VTLERSDALGTGGVPTRREWLRLLDAAEAGAVVLNPAGPFGLPIGRVLLQTVRPRRVSRPARAQSPWLDPAQRRAERRRQSAFMAELRAAVDRGDVAAVTALAQDLDAFKALGSPMGSAALQYESGRGMLLTSTDGREALSRMVLGAVKCNQAGDPWRATDGLLAVGAHLAQAPSPRSDWQIALINEVTEMLTQLRTGYRDADLATLARAAEYAR
jgi:hypothetical protein